MGDEAKVKTIRIPDEIMERIRSLGLKKKQYQNNDGSYNFTRTVLSLIETGLDVEEGQDKPDLIARIEALENIICKLVDDN
jgi:hypothetical protein